MWVSAVMVQICSCFGDKGVITDGRRQRRVLGVVMMGNPYICLYISIILSEMEMHVIRGNMRWVREKETIKLDDDRIFYVVKRMQRMRFCWNLTCVLCQGTEVCISAYNTFKRMLIVNLLNGKYWWPTYWINIYIVEQRWMFILSEA